MNPLGGDTPLWDEEDGFFYDVLRLPDGTTIRLRVRSLVGLLPLCAATVFEPEVARRPAGAGRAGAGVRRRTSATRVPALAHLPGPNPDGRRLLALVDEDQLRRILADARRGRVPRPARHPLALALPRRAPVRVRRDGQDYGVGYLPAESDTGMFGGNSNWRGPVWFPVNLLIIRALLNLTATTATTSPSSARPAPGDMMKLFEVAQEIGRPAHADLPARRGRPPAGATAGQEMFQDDPHWRDLILFYEYFHGDNGAGLGAATRPAGPGCAVCPTWAPVARPRAADRAGLPTGPTVYEINTAVWLDGRAAARRRSRGARPTWDEVARCRRRRRLADGRLGAQPGRPGDRPATTRADGGVPARRCPTCARRTWSARRTACATTSSTRASAARRAGAARPARRARPGLILDYVPNHVAPDHPWLTPHPELVRPRAPRTTWRATRPPACASAARSSPAAATRTSRRGRTWCSSTPSRPRCARRCATLLTRSASSATACAATWRC